MKKYIYSERSNLFEPNVYISMVASIEGNVTGEEILNAVNTAYSMNEATLSKIVLEESGEAYYESLETTGCKVCLDDRDYRVIICENEKRTFAINEGELVRTFVISKENGFQILIMAHHLVGDGKSILVLLQDILDALAGKEPEYKPMELLDESRLAKKAALPLGVQAWIDYMNKRWRRSGQVFTWEQYYSVHRKYWDKHSSKIREKTYSAEALKRECDVKATLNSFLITGLLQEFPDSKVIGVPVSIREGSGTMANLTSGIAVRHQYNPNKSFENNLVSVHKKLRAKLKHHNSKYFVLLFVGKLCPPLVDGVLLETHDCYHSKLTKKAAHIMGYLGNSTRDLGVTNLMRIEIANNAVNFSIQDILFIPPKVSYAKNVVGISTWADKLTICYHEMVVIPQ